MFKNFLAYALVFIIISWAFWGLYVASMGLYRSYLRKTMTPMIKVLSIPYIAAMLVVDTLFNLIFGTLIFLELPTTWLLTQRLIKKIKEKETDDYRYKLSMWVCKNMLDPIDPTGQHCTGDGYKETLPVDGK